MILYKFKSPRPGGVVKSTYMIGEAPTKRGSIPLDAIIGVSFGYLNQGAEYAGRRILLLETVGQSLLTADRLNYTHGGYGSQPCQYMELTYRYFRNFPDVKGFGVYLRDPAGGSIWGLDFTSDDTSLSSPISASMKIDIRDCVIVAHTIVNGIDQWAAFTFDPTEDIPHWKSVPVSVSDTEETFDTHFTDIGCTEFTDAHLRASVSDLLSASGDLYQKIQSLEDKVGSISSSVFNRYIAR